MVEKIRRIERGQPKSSHVFLRTVLITLACLLSLALGFLGAAFFAGTIG